MIKEKCKIRIRKPYFLVLAESVHEGSPEEALHKAVQKQWGRWAFFRQDSGDSRSLSKNGQVTGQVWRALSCGGATSVTDTVVIEAVPEIVYSVRKRFLDDAPQVVSQHTSLTLAVRSLVRLSRKLIPMGWGVDVVRNDEKDLLVEKSGGPEPDVYQVMVIGPQGKVFSVETIDLRRPSRAKKD